MYFSSFLEIIINKIHYFHKLRFPVYSNIFPDPNFALIKYNPNIMLVNVTLSIYVIKFRKNIKYN